MSTTRRLRPRPPPNRRRHTTLHRRRSNLCKYPFRTPSSVAILSCQMRSHKGEKAMARQGESREDRSRIWSALLRLVYGLDRQVRVSHEGLLFFA